MKFLEPVNELLVEINLKIETFNLQAKPSSTFPHSSRSAQCKLPKLELPVFNGIVA